MACPTDDQCTAVDVGEEETFDPGTGVSPGPISLNALGLFGVDCPSTEQCTAVGNGGLEVTFDPTHPGLPPSGRRRNRPRYLAGLRLGYLLLDSALAPHVNAVQEPFNVNVAALAAGIASLRRTYRLPARREQVTRARRALCEPLRSTAVRAIPSDANFVLLDLAGDDDARIAEALAREGILVRAGSEFGLPGHVRVTTGQEALMDDVAHRLALLAGG